MDVEERLWFRGKNRSDIAKDLGMTPGMFSKICRGRHPLPLSHVAPLAELLQATPAAIVDAFDAVRKAAEEEKTNGD